MAQIQDITAQQSFTSSNFEDILAARRISNDFRWASRSWTPSPYFSRGNPRDIREICMRVFQCESVVKAIKEVAAREGKEETEISKRAHDIIQELTHNFHLYAVRWFGLVLSKLGKKLYSNIYVNKDKIEEIRRGFERYPVILLPTHRSYVDFLLLSYVCFTYSLPLPIIAAGMDFMNMTGVAELLRKSGAFFIRRRFGNDALYWAIISEYISCTIMQGGHPMEFFIEGTRSRTGKSLSPKLGLLTQVMGLVRSRAVSDILILPITMSYDRTLEEKLYAHELLGQPKPKESTNGLLKALRWLGSQQYGSIYVNFGNFLSVNQILGMDSLCPLDDRMFNKVVQDASIQVILSHQENIVVPLFSAIATVALTEISQGRKSIMLSQMMKYIVGFQQILAARGLFFGYPLSNESLERNILYLLKSVHTNLVTLAPADQRVWFNLDNQDNNEIITCMQFQHYSNQLIYLIVPFCLVTMITSKSDLSQIPQSDTNFQDEGISLNQDEISHYTCLRQLFSEEFVYQRGVELMEIMFATETWNSLVLLRDTNSNYNLDPRKMKRCLKKALGPFVLAYWGVVSTLLQIGSTSPTTPVEIKSFGKLCQNTLRQTLSNRLCQYYGALSLDCMNNAVMSLINSGGLSKTKMLDSNAPGFIIKDFKQISNIRIQLGKLLGDICCSESSSPTAGSAMVTEEKQGPDSIKPSAAASQIRCLRSKL